MDFSDPTDDGKVPIEVWAEKSVWTNITANPQKVKREFLTELEAVRERPIEDLREESIDFDQGQSSSTWLLGAVGYPISIIVGGFIGVVFSLAFTTTILDSLNDSVGILGLFVGSVAGGVAWYHRDHSTVNLAGKYVGVTFIGIILAAIIQTAFNLYGAVGSLVFLVIPTGRGSGVATVRATREK